MSEKTRSDFQDGGAGDGTTLSASPPPLLASSMENKDAFEGISFRGKNPNLEAGGIWGRFETLDPLTGVSV